MPDSTSSITVSLNGNQQLLPLGCTVAQAIEVAGFNGKKIAAAVNGAFVPRSQYTDHKLNDGDGVDLVTAVGGG